MKKCEWCGDSLKGESVVIADENVCLDCYTKTIPYSTGVFVGNRGGFK